jgi:hypothetical protein
MPRLAQTQAHHFDLMQRQRLALASDGFRDPQPNEGLLAPNLHRASGDANPLLIAVALGLW